MCFVNGQGTKKPRKHETKKMLSELEEKNSEGLCHSL